MESTQGIVYYQNYTPVGDLMVLATCFVFIVLMYFAYNIKTKNYRIFCTMVGLLMVAAISDVIYHVLLNSLDTVPHVFIYVFRHLHHFALFSDLFLYVVYVMEPLHLDEKYDKRFVILAGAGLIGITVYEVLGTVLGYGFYIHEDGSVSEGFNIFPFGYVFFLGIIMFLLIVYRNRMVKQILYGIIGTYLVSFILIYAQGRHGQTSFTTACFLFPVIALLYLIHSNPYDIEIGAVGVSAFDDMISYIQNHKEQRFLMSLFMKDFEGTGRHYPKEIQATIRAFTHQRFKGAILFQLSNGRMVLSVNPKKNPNYKTAAGMMLDDFDKAYPKFKLDYKIVITMTDDEISENHDYIRLLQFIEERMPENTYHQVEQKDFDDFREMKYVHSQLEDIAKSGNLDDERVEVFCQPVLNILTGKYDTAEALMRLRLPEKGLIMPFIFIPLAEKYHLIHSLSLIILHKTCMRIRSMLDKGYNVQRISVNFAVSEVLDENFISDINRIIQDAGVPHEKIAIEITESQSEDDFQMMKNTIEKLRDSGIKFYLDDFGTGYSNFERIMELPFDIIKFDRSLVIACAEDKKSEKMVSYLAKMFSAMDYSVLYEGVETKEDEEKCIQMSAKYLQGFKYSKPIPIEELTDWFELSA